jgi:hypothetical protein
MELVCTHLRIEESVLPTILLNYRQDAYGGTERQKTKRKKLIQRTCGLTLEIRRRRRARTNYIRTVCFLCSILYEYIFVNQNVKIMLRNFFLLFYWV